MLQSLVASPVGGGKGRACKQAIVVRGGEIVIGGDCAAVRVRQKPSKRGTQLDARWPQCTNVKGPVRFRGIVDPTCTTLRGTVVGRKAKLHHGALRDLAPTVLALMDLPKPAEMTGHSLVEFAA